MFSLLLPNRKTTFRAFFPAKMMALLAYRLLKDGAAGAKEVMADCRPPYTVEQYKDYVKQVSG